MSSVLQFPGAVKNGDNPEPTSVGLETVEKLPVETIQVINGVRQVDLYGMPLPPDRIRVSPPWRGPPPDLSPE